MSSPMPYGVLDDKDLDDAALWAVIDSAAAAHSSSAKSRKPLAIQYPNQFNSPPPHQTVTNASPPSKLAKTSRSGQQPSFSDSDSKLTGEGEVLQEPWVFRPPRKIPRICSSEYGEMSPMTVGRSVERMPGTMSYPSPEKHLSPEIGGSEWSPVSSGHCLSGMFPSVSVFKEYQKAAMAILEKSDCTMISGNHFIKKSGWRKISFYFNLSYEIRDKSIEFDEHRNVQRAEFVVRASMQGGRFSDGWGSCERRERRFMKANHDIPSTAETRAKNKACQEIEGWPLGLRPLNERLMDFSVGSISFNTTLLTASPTNSSSISSSDLDTQSTCSFFHDKSKTLGSLIGVSNILEVPRRTTTPEAPRIISLKPTKPWLFSLCSKLTTDAVIATNHRTNNNNKTPSLSHFLEAERRAVSTSRTNQSQSHARYGPNDYSPVNMRFSGSNSNSLFVNDLVAPNPSSASGVSSNGAKSHSELLVPLLFPRLCGQLIKC